MLTKPMRNTLGARSEEAPGTVSSIEGTRSQKQLPHWQTVRNKLIGRIRGAIERTFSVLKRRYGFVRMRYLGLKANAFHLDLTAIAFNLRIIAAKSR